MFEGYQEKGGRAAGGGYTSREYKTFGFSRLYMCNYNIITISY